MMRLPFYSTLLFIPLCFLAVDAANGAQKAKSGSFIELDTVVRSNPKPQEPAVSTVTIRVDSAGDVVDPDCYYTASELVDFAARHQTSGAITNAAINRHTDRCNKVREMQHRNMDRQREQMSRIRDQEERDRTQKEEHARQARQEQYNRQMQQQQLQMQYQTQRMLESQARQQAWEEKQRQIEMQEMQNQINHLRANQR